MVLGGPLIITFNHFWRLIYHMKEIQFVRYNIEKWERLETMAGNLVAYSPDDIAGAYKEVTYDLAFAYTHYPESRVTPYLNGIASVLCRVTVCAAQKNHHRCKQ